MSADPARAAVPRLPALPGGDRRLVVLMAARLALAVLSLGIALALEAAVNDVDRPGRRGLYATVALAFLATAIQGLVLPRIRRPARVATASLAVDAAIVSSLVLFSGGPDSVFTFLYVGVALYGALLFDRRGVLIAAGLGSSGYAVVLVASQFLPGLGRELAPALLFALWALHAGAMLLVAALASFLAAELHRAGEALIQRTSDLRELAELHRRIVDSLMSGLLTTDIERRVTSWNPEAERITGAPAAEVLGRPLQDVLPGLPALARGGESRAQSRTRTPYRNRRGEDLHLGVGVYALKDGSGQPSGLVVIFQDLTEVVAMERELRRSERLAAVGELSASIAHEIRNPLAAISGSIQLLSTPAAPRGSREATRLREIVLRETDRLNLLITDFLRYARPGPLRIEAVPLRGLVAELREMLGSVLPPGVEVQADVPDALAVQGDAAQLRQILWNLALNSLQAMPSGGVLAISAAPASPQGSGGPGRNHLEEAKEGEAVDVCVRDGGTGIAPEILDRVFDPFFTTKPGGSGLGLATVHRIVEEHGGSLRVESQVGSGTAVWLRLPRAEDAT